MAGRPSKFNGGHDSITFIHHQQVLTLSCLAICVDQYLNSQTDPSMESYLMTQPSLPVLVTTSLPWFRSSMVT